MARVLILVEGPTEAGFVARVLDPHLQPLGVYAIPKVIHTSKAQEGPVHKGGIGSYKQVRRELQGLLRDSSAVLVTTMIDYYGRPDDFPGPARQAGQTCFDHAALLEQAFQADVGDRRFRPYLQVHEFEALVFVDPSILAQAVGAEAGLEAGFRKIREAFASPEEIDDDPKTAPSRRLRALCPQYDKALHGPLITMRTGVARLRQECQHFNEWLADLERVATS